MDWKKHYDTIQFSQISASNVCERRGRKSRREKGFELVTLGMGIGNKGAAIVRNALAFNSTLTSLDLSGMG